MLSYRNKTLGQLDTDYPKSDSSFLLNTKIPSMKPRCSFADYSRETLIMIKHPVLDQAAPVDHHSGPSHAVIKQKNLHKPFNSTYMQNVFHYSGLTATLVPTRRGNHARLLVSDP